MKNQVKKSVVGLIGGIVLIAGIVMIPYPGPGWLVVFAGLGILSTEFVWAQKVLHYAKGKYDAWQAWVGKQTIALKALLWVLTAAVVIVTIWLLDGYGILNHLTGLGWEWLNSPLPIFHQ